MSKPSKRKVYVLRVETFWGEEGERGAPKVWSFADRAAAEAYQKQLTRTCRDNPFRGLVGGSAFPSSGGAEGFRDRVRSIGLEPPAAEESWSDWWYENFEQPDTEAVVGAEDLSRIRDFLDLANPHPLFEEEVDAPASHPTSVGREAFVVQRYHWSYTDEWYYVAGDDPLKAYTNRERAEVECRERERHSREEFVTPLGMGESLDRLTSLAPETLLDRIRGLGLNPPVQRGVAGGGIYQIPNAWWERLRRADRDAYHRVWDLFDRVRFHEVVPVELRAESGGA